MSMVPTNTESESSTQPTIPEITLPLPLFLQILWAYKKGAELRERAVPGKEIVAILRSVPEHEQWYHIQDQEDCESTVWQREYWKGTGERTVERDAKLKVLWGGIDSVIEALAPKFPMFNRPALQQFADGLIQNKQWEVLRGLGVDTTQMEKEL